MEPQHCMLCWSWVIADIQSANCKPNRATNATTMNSLLRIPYFDSTEIRHLSQRKDTAIERKFRVGNVDRNYNFIGNKGVLRRTVAFKGAEKKGILGAPWLPLKILLFPARRFAQSESIPPNRANRAHSRPYSYRPVLIPRKTGITSVLPTKRQLVCGQRFNSSRFALFALLC